MGVRIDKRNATGRVDEWGHEGNDTILGGRFDDMLAGAQGHDSIRGGEGNDYIRDFTIIPVIYTPVSHFRAFEASQDIDDFVEGDFTTEQTIKAEDYFDIMTAFLW